MSEKPITHRAGPRLTGRVAIVTGGGRGIGSATAQVLAAEGAFVLVATRTAGPGQATVDAIVAAGGKGEPSSARSGGSRSRRFRRRPARLRPCSSHQKPRPGAAGGA